MIFSNGVCPICKIELSEAILHKVGINYCQKCLGLWFEEDELRMAKDEKDKQINWLDIDLWQDRTKFKINRGQKLCPSCRLPLYEAEYGDSQIIVDLCNLCHGIWLDRGEFKKIIEYLQQKASYEVLHNYAQNLIREFREVFIGPETLKQEILDFLTVLKLLNYKFIVQHSNIVKTISELPK